MEQLWNTPGMLAVSEEIAAQGIAITSEQESLIGLVNSTSSFQEGANKEAYTAKYLKWGEHVREFSEAVRQFSTLYSEVATNKAASEMAKAGQWA